MLRLDNPVQHYAWGSREAIPRLLGVEPDGTPWAEMWMGAHPSAPSRVENGATLGEHIAADPERMLGVDVARRFGAELPFLFKVLAAAEPLSLQAHPSAAQARAGFDAEEAAGVPRDAAHRNYKDPRHKPELLCALEPFEALCGFRPVAETLALFDALRSDAVASMQQRLRAHPNADGLREVFTGLMRMPADPRLDLVRDVVEAARRLDDGPFAHACAWAVRLYDKYPGDAGVVASLLLNCVTLAPGDAVFLPAGNLHAYLHGTGLELMANSDNVLRGGLTPKHVDLDALLSILDFTPFPFAPLRPSDDGVYPTSIEEFRLSRVRAPFEGNATGPEILLVVDGRARTDGLVLERGASVFVPPGRFRIDADPKATIFRASVG